MLIVKILMVICFLNLDLAAGKYFTNLKKENKQQLLQRIQGYQVMLLNQL